MKDRCGFLFVRYKRHCCTELVSWEHTACLLSWIKKRPLVGGWLNTSSVVISIGATASVHYREVVRYGRFHCTQSYTRNTHTLMHAHIHIHTQHTHTPIVRHTHLLYDTHTHTHTHTQGARNKAAFPPDVVEAYKYTFSQPGALTAPLNYYRCMLQQRREAAKAPLKKTIDVPTLIIWVGNLTANLLQ